MTMNIPSAYIPNILSIPNTLVSNMSLESRNVRVSSQNFEQKVIYLNVRPTISSANLCPCCMQKCSTYDHQSGSVSWRASNFNGVPVILNYSPARIHCPEHGIIRELIPWADGSSRFTPDFNNEVAWMALQLPKTSVSQYFQISWQTVGNCINAAHHRLEPDISQRLVGLRRICVDETSYSKGHKYITVVYDMDRNRVVWVHKDHGFSVFEEFCLLLTEEQRAAITVVAGDGARWIDSCTSLYFPNAARCIDPFHVVGWANEALDKVRMDAAHEAKSEYEKTEKSFVQSIDISSSALEEAKQEYVRAVESLDVERQEYLKVYIETLEEFKDVDIKSISKRSRKWNRLLSILPDDKKEVLIKLKELYKDLKNARYAVGKNPEHRTESQNDKLEIIQKSSPDLYAAYKFKEELRTIVHMKDPDGAANEIDRLIDSGRATKIVHIVELSDKLLRHKPNLVNTIKYQANSAKSESCNAQIKGVIARAKGFRNLNNLKSMVYLKCSDITVPLNNRPFR